MADKDKRSKKERRSAKRAAGNTRDRRSVKSDAKERPERLDPARKPGTIPVEKPAEDIPAGQPGGEPAAGPQAGSADGKPPEKTSADGKAGDGKPSRKPDPQKPDSEQPGSQKPAGLKLSVEKPAAKKPIFQKPGGPKPAAVKPGGKPDALKKGVSPGKDTAWKGAAQTEKAEKTRDVIAPPASTGFSRAGVIIAIVAVILVVVMVYQFRPEDRTQAPGPAMGGPFTLVDTEGRTVTDATFRGQFMLVYFGYTYCPDVCPTALTAIADTLEILGNRGEKVQPIFITIDPERDTVEGLKEYIGFFHPRQVGLTGSAELVRAAAKAYRVFYAKAGESGDDYLMDHTPFIYLIGPKGNYRTHFVQGTTPEEMARRIREFL